MNNETKRILGLFLIGFLILSTPAWGHKEEVLEETKPQKIGMLSKPVLEIPTARSVVFSRARQVEIIEENPHLKPENQSLKLSNNELIDILKGAGFSGDGLRMAWAIVMLESTARPYAHNDNPSTGDNSYGLFQINMRGSMGPDRREKYGLSSNKDLFDPAINAEIAYKMSNGGTVWGPWTTSEKARQLSYQFSD